jgi:protein-L-isoaspartate(D-aspartate) O-methyltransferase
MSEARRPCGWPQLRFTFWRVPPDSEAGPSGCGAYGVLRATLEARVIGTPPADDRVGRMGFLLGLRRRGICDPAVLRAMDEVPREHFVRPENLDSAYADHAMPIACGQTISQPYVVAYMTEQLSVEPHHRVLEVGTGSGYQAAVLSRLAHDVVSIERYRTLADAARVRLETLGFNNVQVVLGDGFVGMPDHAPFDRIVVTAAAEEVPNALIEQLADDGIMVLPLGPHAGAQLLVKLTKTKDRVMREKLIAVRFVPLVHGQAREL